MSQEIYTEFADLGVSIIRIGDNIKTHGPESILTNETYIQKLKDNKQSLIDYIITLETSDAEKNRGVGVATAALDGQDLKLTFTDGTVVNVGDVVGDGFTGKDGVDGLGFSFAGSWSSGESFTQNTVVKKDGKVFIANANSGLDKVSTSNLNKNPTSEPTYWDVLVDIDESVVNGGSF